MEQILSVLAISLVRTGLNIGFDFQYCDDLPHKVGKALQGSMERKTVSETIFNSESIKKQIR